MFETLKRLFGLGPSTNYAQLVKEGAVILDVRTKGEYASGHIRGSVNISVDQLSRNLDRIPNKQVPIITCCASGMRSASAKGMLKAKGYVQVYNGGSWIGLQARI